MCAVYYRNNNLIDSYIYLKISTMRIVENFNTVKLFIS